MQWSSITFFCAAESPSYFRWFITQTKVVT